MKYTAGGEHATHALNIIGIEGDRVMAANPWGREHFSFKNLKNRATGALILQSVEP